MAGRLAWLTLLAGLVLTLVIAYLLGAITLKLSGHFTAAVRQRCSATWRRAWQPAPSAWAFPAPATSALPDQPSAAGCRRSPPPVSCRVHAATRGFGGHGRQQKTPSGSGSRPDGIKPSNRPSTSAMLRRSCVFQHPDQRVAGWNVVKGRDRPPAASPARRDRQGVARSGAGAGAGIGAEAVPSHILAQRRGPPKLYRQPRRAARASLSPPVAAVISSAQPRTAQARARHSRRTAGNPAQPRRDQSRRPMACRGNQIRQPGCAIVNTIPQQTMFRPRLGRGRDRNSSCQNPHRPPFLVSADVPRQFAPPWRLIRRPVPLW